MGDAFDRETLLRVQEAVASGSARRCNAALDCKLRKCGTAIPLDTKLTRSTAKAANLLGLLPFIVSKEKCNQRLREGEDLGDSLSVEQTLRALLMIDLSYATPWMALCEFALLCHGLPVSSLMGCVTMIEEFLMLRSVTGTPIGGGLHGPSEEEYAFPEDSPAGFMLQFATTLADQYYVFPEFHDGDGKDVNDHNVVDIDKSDEEFFFPLITDILGTTVRASRDWNCSAYNDRIVATVLLRQPPPARSIAWLRMAYELRFVLSSDQMQRFGKVLLNQLCKNSVCFVRIEDPSSLYGMVADLANPTCSLSSSNGDSNHDSKVWRTVILHMLYLSSFSEVEYYSVIEECLSNLMSEWDAAALEVWIEEIKNDFANSFDPRGGDYLPSWFVWNAIAVCLEAMARKYTWNSALRGNLFERTTSHGVEVCESYRIYSPNDSRNIHSAVLEVAFGSNVHCEKIFDRVDELQYMAAGVFKYTEGLEVKVVSSCGCGVLQSLLLGKTISEYSPKDDLFVVRAYRLTALVDDLVTNCCEDDWHKMAILAASVKTVAYFEVDGFREVLVSKIRQDIDRRSSDHRLTKCHMVAIRLIFASAGNGADSDKLLHPFCDLVVENTETNFFVDLIEILGRLPTARTKILQCSKKLLAPLYAAFTGHHDNSNEDTPYCRRLRNGILGLLRLIRREEWTTTEIDAWKTLSDIIVLDLPHIGLINRRWLYGIFERLVVDSSFPMTTSEHLVRAFTIRLGSFLDNGDNGTFLINRSFRAKAQRFRPQMKDGIQTDDVLILHRLVSLFLRTLATVGVDYEKRSVLLAQGREAFLRSILLQKGEHLPQHRLITNFCKRGLRTYNGQPDTFALCWMLFLEVNFKLMSHLCCVSQGSSSDQQGDCSTEITAAYLIESIIKMEGEELKSRIGFPTSSRSFLPSWLSRSEPLLYPSLESLNIDLIMLQKLKAALVDLLIEFLFIAPFPTSGSDHFADPLCWKVVAGTGVLISQRRRLLHSDFLTDPANDIHSLSTDTLFQTAESFFSVSSSVIRDAIHRDCALSVFEELIFSILFFCDALYFALQRSEEKDCSALTCCLWDLYQSTSSESASLKIIQYMESHLSENGNQEVLTHDQNQLSLTDMRSEKDVDDAMQKIRLRCIRPLQSCFPYVAVDARNEERSRLTVSVHILGGILAALANDLQVGLNGRSGGITPDIFLAYCGSIEECSTLIFEYGMTSSIELSVVSLFAEVMATLTGILHLFPLRDAVLFRTTFILAAVVLPSMCRDLLRQRLCVFRSGSTPMKQAFNTDSGLLHRTLEDSLEILARWGGLREPFLVPWRDIAGSEHAETNENDLGSKDKELNMKSSLVSLDETHDPQEEIPRIVCIPSPRRLKRKWNHVQPVRRIRLHTKEVWSWALSCSLLGLEQKWLESQGAINTRNTRWDEDRLKHTSDWSFFYRAHKRELQESLVLSTKFLNPSSDSSQLDDSGQQVILDVLATNLPSAPRMRLCCAIECILRVLVLAISHVHSCLVEGRERSNTLAFNRLSFLEAFCCLSAWLSSADSIDGELSTGVLKWLAIVSRKRPPGETSAKRSGSVDLFSRVSQLSELAHELNSKLKFFQTYLLENAIQPKEHELICISKVFFDGVSNSDNNQILTLVSSKLHGFQKVIHGGLKTRRFPEFPFNRDPEIGSQKVERKRTRARKRSPGMSSTRAKSTRNRNKVVDMFMDLDQGIEPTERRSAGDAYADLEDFLVEG